MAMILRSLLRMGVKRVNKFKDAMEHLGKERTIEKYTKGDDDDDSKGDKKRIINNEKDKKNDPLKRLAKETDGKGSDGSTKDGKSDKGSPKSKNGAFDPFRTASENKFNKVDGKDPVPTYTEKSGPNEKKIPNGDLKVLREETKKIERGLREKLEKEFKELKESKEFGPEFERLQSSFDKLARDDKSFQENFKHKDFQKSLDEVHSHLGELEKNIRNDRNLNPNDEINPKDELDAKDEDGDSSHKKVKKLVETFREYLDVIEGNENLYEDSVDLASSREGSNGPKGGNSSDKERLAKAVKNGGKGSSQKPIDPVRVRSGGVSKSWRNSLEGKAFDVFKKLSKDEKLKIVRDVVNNTDSQLKQVQDPTTLIMDALKNAAKSDDSDLDIPDGEGSKNNNNNNNDSLPKIGDKKKSKEKEKLKAKLGEAKKGVSSEKKLGKGSVLSHKKDKKLSMGKEKELGKIDAFFKKMRKMHKKYQAIDSITGDQTFKQEASKVDGAMKEMVQKMAESEGMSVPDEENNKSNNGANQGNFTDLWDKEKGEHQKKSDTGSEKSKLETPLKAHAHQKMVESSPSHIELSKANNHHESSRTKREFFDEARPTHHDQGDIAPQKAGPNEKEAVDKEGQAEREEGKIKALEEIIVDIRTLFGDKNDKINDNSDNRNNNDSNGKEARVAEQQDRIEMKEARVAEQQNLDKVEEARVAEQQNQDKVEAQVETPQDQSKAEEAQVETPQDQGKTEEAQVEKQQFQAQGEIKEVQDETAPNQGEIKETQIELAVTREEEIKLGSIKVEDVKNENGQIDKQMQEEGERTKSLDNVALSDMEEIINQWGNERQAREASQLPQTKEQGPVEAQVREGSEGNVLNEQRPAEGEVATQVGRVQGERIQDGQEQNRQKEIGRQEPMLQEGILHNKTGSDQITLSQEDAMLPPAIGHNAPPLLVAKHDGAKEIPATASHSVEPPRSLEVTANGTEGVSSNDNTSKVQISEKTNKIEEIGFLEEDDIKENVKVNDNKNDSEVSRKLEAKGHSEHISKTPEEKLRDFAEGLPDDVHKDAIALFERASQSNSNPADFKEKMLNLIKTEGFREQLIEVLRNEKNIEGSENQNQYDKDKWYGKHDNLRTEMAAEA